MFKMPISAQTENHKQKENVATDKKWVLWKMDVKFPNPKFNPYKKPLELRDQWNANNIE